MNGTTPSLSGNVAIVTGASSGIGAATALELARRGARVVLAARRDPELRAQVRAISDIGGEAVAVPTDLSDREQITRLAERAAALFGQIDILVNNAGLAEKTPFERADLDDIALLADVNLRGAMLLTRVVLPGMLQRRRGAIISVASVAAHVATSPLYAGTKFGLRGFSLGLRREMLDSGVSVSLVSPGFIRTPMTGNRRWMPGPEIVAITIADLIAHPRAEVVVPGGYRGLIWLANAAPALTDLAVRLRRRLG